METPLSRCCCGVGMEWDKKRREGQLLLAVSILLK